MRFFLMTVVAVLFAAGCGSGDSAGGRSSGPQEVDKTLRINLSTAPQTIDPLMASGVPEHKLMLGLFDPLVRLDADAQPVPAAAERWEHNEDYTEWTFYLRENGKWHNGDPVTANDFKYSMERLFTPSVASPYAGVILPHILGAQDYYDAGGMDSDMEFEGVEVIDDTTIKYKMACSAPYFITFVQLFSFMPVHRDTIESNPDSWAMEPETFIGNGPFMMSEHQRGSRIIATPSGHYWNREKIFWEEIHYLMIDDASTENAAFINGEVDLTESISTAELSYWEQRPEYDSKPLLATYFVSFNTQRKPFDDARVRKAFSMVIDRELIVERVTKRHEPIARGFVPAEIPSPTGGNYGDVAGDFLPRGTVEEARALLAEAGYNENNPLPEVEYIYNNSEEHKAIGEQLQRIWSETLNADVRLQNVEWGEFLSRANNHDFDFCRSSWIGDYLDPMTFLEIFTTGNTKNAPQYANPDYDALLEQARQEGDPVLREELMAEAEAMLIERDNIVAPIYTYISPILISEGIVNFDRNILGNYLYIYARREKQQVAAAN